MHQAAGNIYAEQMGYDVCARLSRLTARGKIHSVFQDAVNITLSDKYFFSIIDRHYGSVPFGISVRKADRFFFSDLGIRAGEEVTIKDDCIFHAGNPLLSWRDASVEKKKEDHIPVPFDHDLIHGHCRHVRQHVLSQGKRGGFYGSLACFNDLFSEKQPACDGLDEINRYAVFLFESLIPAFIAEDSKKSKSLCIRLVGLGCGLTPSGDDFLTGLFATLVLSKRQPAFDPDFIDELRQYMRTGIEGLTSKISEVYLGYALQGEVSDVLYNFIRGVYGAGADELVDLTRDLMNTGSSSGMDMILGCLFAFRLMAAKHQRNNDQIKIN